MCKDVYATIMEDEYIQWVCGICMILPVLFYLYCRQLQCKKLDAIPGSSWWPFHGNIFQIDPEKPFITFAKWMEKYGDIFTVHFPLERAVILNSPELIREMLITKGVEFGGRPPSWRFKYITQDYSGIGFCLTPGATLKNRRKVLIHALRVSETCLTNDTAASDVIHEMVMSLKEKNEKPCDPMQLIKETTSNIIALKVCGRTFQAGGKEMAMLEDIFISFNASIESSGVAAMLEAMPWLRFFGHPTWKWMQKHNAAHAALVGKMIDSMRATFNPENENRGVVDQFFRVQMKESSQDNEPVLTQPVFETIVNQMFVAGITSTLGVLYSWIYLLACFPDVQQKAYHQVTEKIGERQVSVNDMSELSYIVATIYESIRYASQEALLLPHFCFKEATLGGYIIPKDTVVLANLYASDHDIRFWEDPWEFKPERFLTDEGCLVSKDHQSLKNFFHFSYGPRVCPGKDLGIHDLFLMTTTLLQAFEIKPPTDEAMQADLSTFGYVTVHCPTQYQVRFVTHA